jgi:4-hydroxybenzoate polyprenyltransferase
MSREAILTESRDRVVNSQVLETSPAANVRPSLRGHVAICRIDHWIKNVFVLPGILVALTVANPKLTWVMVSNGVLGLLAVCLVASSNYVLNELLYAPYDRCHPSKKNRPVPAGRVNARLAYLQWILLMGLGLTVARFVSTPFTITMFVLWAMGCVYNVRPLRTKDLPVVDVLSEAVNNPLRMLAGWYIVGPDAIPPASLLLSYWMIGCYFMALKRFAELRSIGNVESAAAYRRSFRYYTSERLLVSVTFYGSAAMLFFGAFIMRYRMELILSFPAVAVVMAMYMRVAFKRESSVQAPERLYTERLLMTAVICCTFLMCLLLLVDLPILYKIFTPTVPASDGAWAAAPGAE